VLQVSAEEYDLALDRVEADLLVLSNRLDGPVEDNLVHRSLITLGTQATSLFRGFMALARSDTPVAALALLRPMVEINLLVRFIVAGQKLHAEIWIAEGELQSLKPLREVVSDPELAAKHGQGIDMAADWAAERERYVEEVRSRALLAGVVGVRRGPGERVMPSMRTIAFNHGDLATREAYALAYRPLSHAVHGSSRAFNIGHFAQVGAGRVRFIEVTDPAGEIRSHRALNATTYASTLCVLSKPLGLNVLDDAETLKSVLMSITTDVG
jgi:hypothetical protein